MTGTRDRDDHAATIRRLEQRISKLERQTPLASTSITRGHLRVASPEGLIVEGSARISGMLDGDGTFHWTGEVQFDGPVRIVGSVTRSGDETATGTTTLNGKTNINGPTTVEGDLDVIGAGEIRVGAIAISPANGGEIRIGALTIHSDGSISHSAGGVRIDALIVEQSTWLEGAVRVPNISEVSAGQTPNLWIDSLGSMRKIV